MTFPAGDPGQTPRDDAGQADEGGYQAYEAPSIEEMPPGSFDVAPGNAPPPPAGAGYPVSPGYPVPPGGYPPPFDPQAPVDYPADYPDPSVFGARPGAAPPPPVAPPMPPGYFPPPGYPPYPPAAGPGYDPYAAYPFGVPPGQNGPSVAALVCALLGVPMCMCFLPSLAAIVLGIMGIQQTGRTGQAGRGLAVAGLVIGATTLLLGVLVTVGGGFTSVVR